MKKIDIEQLRDKLNGYAVELTMPDNYADNVLIPMLLRITCDNTMVDIINPAKVDLFCNDKHVISLSTINRIDERQNQNSMEFILRCGFGTHRYAYVLRRLYKNISNNTRRSCIHVV